jgi:monoamine oxidase
MDPGMKVFLRFSKNFWGDTTSSVFAPGSVPEYISSGLNRGDRNKVLTALINGEKALILGEMEDDAILSQLIGELDGIYGAAVASVNFIEGIVKNWTKEPYIRGVYSFPNVGSLNSNRSIIAQSVNNKLFFAGEATNANGNFGTIHGAVETAERVVDEIIAVLEPA